MLFCWPFLVSRQTVKLMVPVWYLFLRRVIVITGKETQTGPFLHEKKLFPWEHFGKSIPIRTLFMLLVSNLSNSTVMWNTFPKVFHREHFSQSIPTSFLGWHLIHSWPILLEHCMQAKQMLTRHEHASQELFSCQQQQQHIISLRCLAMPDMEIPSKNWGKVDRAALARLVHNRDVDINNLSHKNINAVWKEYFCHCDKKIFFHNYRDFAATFDLEAEFSGARRRWGKMMNL